MTAENGQVGNLPLTPTQEADWVNFLQDRFDLRVMSWGDGSGVPTSGNKLVILGIDNNDLLHIRIFDAGGKRRHGHG